MCTISINGVTNKYFAELKVDIPNQHLKVFDVPDLQSMLVLYTDGYVKTIYGSMEEYDSSAISKIHPFPPVELVSYEDYQKNPVRLFNPRILWNKDEKKYFLVTDSNVLGLNVPVDSDVDFLSLLDKTKDFENDNDVEFGIIQGKKREYYSNITDVITSFRNIKNGDICAVIKNYDRVYGVHNEVYVYLDHRVDGRDTMIDGISAYPHLYSNYKLVHGFFDVYNKFKPGIIKQIKEGGEVNISSFLFAKNSIQERRF